MKMPVRTYKKVIVTNHVIEIYEYQKEPLGRQDFDSNDDYDALDITDTKIDLKDEIDRVEERRNQTVRDARNITRRLALKNFSSGDKFITLTFDPKKLKDKKDLFFLDFVDKEFKKFIQRFNYRFKTKLKYIAVRETHKSGAFHIHMICDWDKLLIYEDEIREWERILGQEVWKHGFVDIKAIDHVDNVGAYIIKYMTKDLPVDLYSNKKLYLCSKGLERPFVYRGYEAEKIIEAYNLEQKKEVFTNSYESEYLGNITYKEFNLKRM